MATDVSNQVSIHARVRPGLVLRMRWRDDVRYLRITHVFPEELYGMWITTAEGARYAKRPFPLPWARFDKWARTVGSCLGKLSLPHALTRDLDEDEEVELESQWLAIEPLVHLLGDRRNLHRSNFSALVRDRAVEIETHFNCVLRHLIRYYYFGADKRGLLLLPSGPQPRSNSYCVQSNPKRRGVKSAALEAKFGPNEFVVSEFDILDMVQALETKLKEGSCFIPEIHEYYLRKQFAKRHPEEYQQLISGNIQAPVTERQFRYYISRNEFRVDKDLLVNKKGAKRPGGNAGALRAFGPGSASEIDATGGRIILVTKGPRPVELGTPWIYLVIDRWSRYVVGIYITLRAPSFAEVRHALLAMLTSRERYRLIGCNISDEEWPPGSAPAALICDRGSEFLSEAFEEAVAEQLLIPLDVLPPLVPDGKAIVERAIGTIKRRASAKMKKRGGYMERPTSSPKASNQFRRARKLAVHSLADLYRVFVDVVRDYNNRPHKTLKQYAELAANGIAPTPRDAFLYGRQYISGADVGAMSDEDFRNLLLDQDEAEGVDQRLRYRGELYEPQDNFSRTLASSWRKKPVPLRISVDELGREARVWTKTGWATFRLRSGNLAQAGAFTPEEQVGLRRISSASAVVTSHRELVRRLGCPEISAKREGRARQVNRADKLALRREETGAMNLQLAGQQPRRKSTPASVHGDLRKRAAVLDGFELHDQLAEIRRHRGLR